MAVFHLFSRLARIVASERELMNKMNTMTQQTGIWSRFKTAVMQPSLSEQSNSSGRLHIRSVERCVRCWKAYQLLGRFLFYPICSSVLCLNKGVIDLRTGAESVEFVSFYGCKFCKWFFCEKTLILWKICFTP